MDNIELAVRLMRCTRTQIKNMVAPANLVYDFLIKQEEVIPVEKLPYEKKIKYWNETSGGTFRRILECKALYIYDILKKDL